MDVRAFSKSASFKWGWLMRQNSRMIVAWQAAATLVCVLAIAAIAQAGITDGLVSYWPLDGNLVDAWGDNDGTLVGTSTVPNFTAGIAGTGIDLDGVDQYVDITGGDESEFDFTAGSLTVSAWFRVDAFDKSWQALVAKGEGQNWRIARLSAEPRVSYAGGVTDIPAAGVGPDVTGGGLHHLAAITENGVSTRLWVDGSLVATGGAPTLTNGDKRVRIGDNPDTTNRSWNGLVDDVAIWDRPLTEAEIGEIYNGGAGAAVRDLYLLDVTTPGDPIVLVSGVNDDDTSAGALRRPKGSRT